jgi:hypothetical protein
MAVSFRLTSCVAMEFPPNQKASEERKTFTEAFSHFSFWLIFSSYTPEVQDDVVSLTMAHQR